MLVILVHLLFIKFLGITLHCDLKYLFCQILIKIWQINENEQLEEINIFAVTAVVVAGGVTMTPPDSSSSTYL